MISQMSNFMFWHNNSVYTQTVPDICLSLTKDNNERCAPYFKQGPVYILQCRNGDVYATGNLSYSNPMLSLYQLSYIPTLIFGHSFSHTIKL